MKSDMICPNCGKKNTLNLSVPSYSRMTGKKGKEPHVVTVRCRNENCKWLGTFERF